MESGKGWPVSPRNFARQHRPLSRSRTPCRAYQGYGLDERPVLPKAEKAVVRHAQGFAAGLKAADYLKFRRRLAAARRASVAVPARAGSAETQWSCTETSRSVELPLCRGNLGGL